jgi:hypothetical protein
MLTLARVVISSAVAYFTFGLAGAAMLLIPGTPHHKSLQQMFVLESYRESPDIDAANAAFDEWLRIGRQSEWVEATVLPTLAAGAILLLWRRKRPLSTIEIVATVAAFTAGVMWRLGATEVDAPLVTTSVVFGLTLAAGKFRQLVGRFRGRAA